jgi:outer membrane biosynthesis protein TonB
VQRFVRGRLLDVSSEFQRYFDAQITRMRSELNADDLREFKNSDGRLPHTAYFSATDVRRGEELARTKARVVQIVWAYLYSGREEQASRALDQMWPAADRERIRAAIVSARNRGIRGQIDGTSTVVASGAEKHSEIVDARTARSTPAPEMKMAGRSAEEKTQNLVRPVPIWIGRLAAQGEAERALAESGVLVDLVIDAAGKVRAAESDDPAFDQSLKNSTAEWKFIPAFRDGRAVASHIYLIVEPKR